MVESIASNSVSGTMKAKEESLADGEGQPEVAKPQQCVQNKDPPLEEEDAEATFMSCSRFLGFLDSNQFPLLILLAIVLAKLYPPLGAEMVQPDITATWIAVLIIFLISGLCLRLDEFAKAFQRLYFNAFVQVFNFGLVSISVFGLTRLLEEVGAIDSALADGMVICSCLPMAINVVIVLTTAAGGDEAAAIFNTTFGNVIGIFLSPALILLYLGTSGDITLAEVFYKLTIRVIVPLVVGLCLRRASDTVARAATTHKKKLKRTQEFSLVFIVYTVFCQTFQEGTDAGVQDILLTVIVQFFLLVSFMGLSWISLEHLGFADEPKLRVMGLFGCSGKTISLGVPLINSIYENDPQRGLYTLPLLIWHPLQLLLGSCLTSRLALFIEKEEARLLQSCSGNERKSSSTTPAETESSMGGAADLEVAAES